VDSYPSRNFKIKTEYSEEAKENLFVPHIIKRNLSIVFKDIWIKIIYIICRA